MHYYTFRVLNSFTGLVECTKWEQNRSHPVETYSISWRPGVLSANMCDCPARVPCRHIKMLKELKDRKIEKFWLVIYEEDVGVVEVYDQEVCVYRELIEE